MVVFVLIIVLVVFILVIILVVVLIVFVLLLVVSVLVLVHGFHHPSRLFFTVRHPNIQKGMIKINSLFKSKTKALLNLSDVEFDALYSQKPFRGIRINPLKSSFNKVQSGFNFKLKKTPFFKNSYYIPKEYEGIGNSPLHHAGAFYVQEPSASSVITAINASPGQKILDLCAAPGGKSTGIAAELCGEGLIWSNEYVRKRASVLLSNIERMGIKNAAISSLSADYLCQSLEGFFDTVLVDAPCSGEGMWRHNEQVEKQWSEQLVTDCAALQRQILSSAVKAVKGGGRLVYSTCTLNLEENENNVKWFLNEFSNFTLEKIEPIFGSRGLSGDENIDNYVRRILPTDGGEGHFIASFKRCDDAACNLPILSENISAANKKIVTDFLRDNFAEIPQGVLYEKNNLVYLVKDGTPELKGDILRFGLLIGEMRKNRLEPAHALFAAEGITPKRSLDLDLDDKRLYAFLKGEEIEYIGDSGYTAVTVLGAPLGFGKCSGKRLTNRYPKGLRLL